MESLLARSDCFRVTERTGSMGVAGTLQPLPAITKGRASCPEELETIKGNA